MHLDVGMKPMNTAWNMTTIDLGLFHHKSEEYYGSDMFYMNALHPGCQRYEGVFEEYFIDGDKTWKMSQYMSFISGSAGGLATITIWMMIITPLPSSFFWPGILLPSSLVLLLAGGAKFLFFDTEICRTALWLPSEGDPIPQKAEGCHLSRDSIISICTSVLSLICVLLICLKAPTRRELDENFGMRYADVNNDMEGLRGMSTMEDSTCDSHANYDAESQKDGAWSPNKMDKTRKQAYDLQDIAEESVKCNIENLPDANRSITSRRSKHSDKGSAQSESLRVVEPSVEYTEKDLNSIIPEKWKKSHKDNEKENFFAEESSMKFVSPASSAYECAGFRSPLKAFVENFSPQKKLKAEHAPIKTTKQYDEEIIQNCLNDLEKSFSE